MYLLFISSDLCTVLLKLRLRFQKLVLEFLAGCLHLGLQVRYLRGQERSVEKEPIWVQKLGPEIEDRFELLRKEQKTLTAMKRLIGTLDSLQAKQFDERVMAELQAWNEGQPLKALYSPKIVLDSSAEDS